MTRDGELADGEALRPRVIVSVIASADGKVSLNRSERLLDDAAGARWRSVWPDDVKDLIAQREADIQRRHHPTVRLEGSGSFVSDSVTAPPGRKGDWPAGLYGDFVPCEARQWFAVVDGHGRVEWTHTSDGEASLVVVASHSTPQSYLNRLRAQRIPYLVAGNDRVDLVLALAKFRSVLKAQAIVSEAGGGLNGALLRAGLIDELHVITVPTLVGGSGTPSIMDGEQLATGAAPVALRTTSVTVGSSGTVWTRYEVTRPAPSTDRGPGHV